MLCVKPEEVVSRSSFCISIITCKTELTPAASCQIRKIAGCACTGNAGNVFPAADLKGNGYLAISACITARASRRCRDACRDCLTAVAGKTFPAFPVQAHLQFYVSDKRPIANAPGLGQPCNKSSIWFMECIPWRGAAGNTQTDSAKCCNFSLMALILTRNSQQKRPYPIQQMLYLYE